MNLIEKEWKDVKKFVKKHKKAILTGAAFVVGGAALLVAVMASPTAATIAAGAAGLSSGSSKSDKKESKEQAASIAVAENLASAMEQAPNLMSVIDNRISVFKENIVQNQFFQLTNPSGVQGLSWEESSRVLGSAFAHDCYNEIQIKIADQPSLAKEIFNINTKYSMPRQWSDSNVMAGHPEIDQQFATDFTHIYGQTHQEMDFSTLSYQLRAERALSLGYFNQAAEDLGKVIAVNPSNPMPYLERAIARFNLGLYDSSLEDYQQFTAHSPAQKADSLSISEFSTGVAKGLPKGMYDSGRGLFVLLSDVVAHPIQTGEQMWEALKLLTDLTRLGQWKVFSEVLAPEVYQLVNEWNEMPSGRRGEMAGYAFGKYGADIFIPGALAKATAKGLQGAQELSRVFKGLKTVEQTLLLEAAAGLESGAKIAEVIELEKRISTWLEEGARLIRNEAGDPIFLSKDGLRRARFDFNRPYPHKSPHAHIEWKIDGVWEDFAGQIYPVDVPHN
jgi:tetratricopeptide (TPR) repeat protein